MIEFPKRPLKATRFDRYWRTITSEAGLEKQGDLHIVAEGDAEFEPWIRNECTERLEYYEGMSIHRPETLARDPVDVERFFLFLHLHCLLDSGNRMPWLRSLRDSTSSLLDRTAELRGVPGRASQDVERRG